MLREVINLKSKIKMGKYAKYKRTYKREWETQPWAIGWLEHITKATNKYSNSLNMAHCRLCNVPLRSHLADLQKHSRSVKHKRAASVIGPKNTLVQHGFSLNSVSTQSKINDIKLSVYIATHSALKSVDHLSELLKSMGQGSNLENIRLHRTKCNNIIRHIVALAMLKELINNVGNSGYSILVDESTDVSIVKYLCLCIRYFNESVGKIVSGFLGILEIERATALDLYKVVTTYMKQINLPISNMIAIGTDGASNLCGVNRSLYTLLKEDVPNLYLIKCVCHSLHLCATQATEELPSALDYLAREIYNWFNNSSLRRIEYKRTFDLINSGLDTNKFLQLVQLSKTRWLVFYEVIKRLLEQWLELKTHFNIVSQNEKCYAARTISSMLNDDTIMLYFIYLKPILQEINTLNILFQSENVDIGSAYTEMTVLVLKFAKKILKPAFLIEGLDKPLLVQVCDALNNELAYLALEDVDFGIEFENNVQKCKVQPADLEILKRRCFNFLKKLLEQMKMRLPNNINIFKCVQFLHPNYCLSKTNQPKFSNLQIEKFLDANIALGIYENQWQNLAFVDWNIHFNNNIPKNILEFWPELFKFTDSAGRYIFRDLATAVLKILCMPISNAVVERIFSVMNMTKTKIRNRMQLPCLEALLRVKVTLNTTQCCKLFVPSNEMIKNFNSHTLYSRDDDAEVAEQHEEMDDCLEMASVLDD